MVSLPKLLLGALALNDVIASGPNGTSFNPVSPPLPRLNTTALSLNSSLSEIKHLYSEVPAENVGLPSSSIYDNSDDSKPINLQTILANFANYVEDALTPESIAESYGFYGSFPDDNDQYGDYKPIDFETILAKLIFQLVSLPAVSGSPSEGSSPALPLQTLLFGSLCS